MTADKISLGVVPVYLVSTFMRAIMPTRELYGSECAAIDDTDIDMMYLYIFLLTEAFLHEINWPCHEDTTVWGTRYPDSCLVRVAFSDHQLARGDARVGNTTTTGAKVRTWLSVSS